MEAWINYNISQEDWKGIIYKANGNTTGYQLFLDSSERVAFGLTTTTGFVRPNAGFTLSPNTWNHIVGSYDGSNMRIYVNGTLYTTLSKTGNILASSTNLYVGMSFASEEFSGKISSARIYNRGVTGNEVLQNYNAGLSRFNTTNIVKSNLLFNLDSSNTVSYPTSGTTWTDLSGYGNTGTLINGPTFNSTSKSIVFDGANDYWQYSARTPNTEFQYYDAFTVEALTYVNESTSNTGLIITNRASRDGNNTEYTGWGLAQYNSSIR